MKKIVSAILLAAVSMAVRRYLARATAQPRGRRQHIETWENEGGALAPHHVPVPTSQVPR
ncbi:MAG: hypothetical protein U1F54_09785 [Burkholderiales bacterium]